MIVAHVFTFGGKKALVGVALSVAFLGLANVPARGQEQSQNTATASQSSSMNAEMAKPAPILVIYKEDVKAGRVPAHNDLEANFAREYAKMPGARHYLAMTSISGPNEAWFLQPYASLEEVQSEYQANDKAPTAIKTELRKIGGGELEDLTNQVAITTLYRDDLSYNVDMSNLPKCRYVEVITFRIRPGRENEFIEATNLTKSAFQKANLPTGWATYQVFAGAPGGTYYVFRALDSLTKADPTNREMMQTFNQALGDEGQKRMMQLTSDAIAMRETNFYAFDPKSSFAPPEFAAADSFWAPATRMANAGTGPSHVGTSGKTTKTAASRKTRKQDR